MLDTVLTVGAVAAAATAVVTALAMIYRKYIQPLVRGFGYVRLFLEDWRGDPPRPGYAGRRGVMERLEKLEHQTARAEFHLGNGNPVPMRKVITDIDERTADLDRRTNVLETTVREHHPGQDRDDPTN